MMKKILVVLLILAVAPVAMANLVVNGSFDDQTGTPWWGVADSIQYTNDTVNNDTILALGWWWYDYVMQDTGNVFLADTVYTMTTLARDGDGASPSATASIIDVTSGWVTLASTTHVFALPTFGDGTPWELITVVFDTATNPGIVGNSIGVGLTAEHNVVAGWTQFDSVILIPEPATMLLLGLGGLMIRKRK